MSTPPRKRPLEEPLGIQDQRKRNRIPTNETLLTARTFINTGANGVLRNAQGRALLPRAPNPPPAGTFQGWNTRKSRKSKSRKSRKSKKSRRTHKN